MIRTLNSAGFYSDETSASLRCTVEPTNCTNFVAYQDGEMVELYWTVSTDIDVTGYEIREGSSFDTGALVATGVTNNFFTVPVDIERLYQYHIVAINKAGFKSSAARTSRVNVENLPPKNVIQTFDELARQSGTHSNTEFGESSINFQTVGGRFSDYTTTKFADLGGSQVLKLKLNTSTGKYPASGTYTLAKINVGSIITAKISVYFVSTVMYAGDVSAVLEFRTSLDNSIWMDWTEFKPVQRRFRYVQFRVKLPPAHQHRCAGYGYRHHRFDSSGRHYRSIRAYVLCRPECDGQCHRRNGSRQSDKQDEDRVHYQGVQHEQYRRSGHGRHKDKRILRGVLWRPFFIWRDNNGIRFHISGR